MRILLVEDDDALRASLEAVLRDDGFAVEVSSTARDGRFKGEEYPLDVAVVDIGLPDGSGVDIIRDWREQDLKFPILILTARNRWEDKVAGLEAGADDYLTKPFHNEELLARLRALLRRATGWTRGASVQCGPYVIDSRRKSLECDGEAITLTAYEFRLLEYLMLHVGEVVSKTELTDHIYEEEADRDSNVLEVLVGRLRRKLDPQKTINPIVTHRGSGYAFRALDA